MIQYSKGIISIIHLWGLEKAESIYINFYSLFNNITFLLLLYTPYISKNFQIYSSSFDFIKISLISFFFFFSFFYFFCSI